MIIYLHRNAVNGKVYIGQTKTILAQRNQHDSNDYKGCGSFWNAIERYSWVGISFLIQFQKMHRNTTLCQTTISKNCKNKGIISVHKANKNYTWMYLTDYLNC